MNKIYLLLILIIDKVKRYKIKIIRYLDKDDNDND